MNEIKVFQFQSNSVRVVNVNGEPWFVAKDVADVLGYRMASDMCRRLDEDEKGTQKTRTPGGEQEVTVINESGLYNAVLGSSKPEAKAFKKWVTSEVLPAIRKHGAYVTNEKLSEWLADPTHMIEALTALKEEREKVKSLENAIEENRPKVVFAESVAVAKTSILVGEMAKLIKQATGTDIGQNRFFEYLRRNGYLHSFGSQKNLPTQRSMDAGTVERCVDGVSVNYAYAENHRQGTDLFHQSVHCSRFLRIFLLQRESNDSLHRHTRCDPPCYTYVKIIPLT